MPTANELSGAEQVADALIEGRMSCNDCPDLIQLVEGVKSGEVSRDDFISTIDLHLRENNRLDKLSKEVL